MKNATLLSRIASSAVLALALAVTAGGVAAADPISELPGIGGTVQASDGGSVANLYLSYGDTPCEDSTHTDPSTDRGYVPLTAAGTFTVGEYTEGCYSVMLFGSADYAAAVPFLYNGQLVPAAKIQAGTRNLVIKAPTKTAVARVEIYGQIFVGQTVRALVYDSVPMQVEIEYQWFRGTKAVTARGWEQSYTITAADAGQDLVAKVWVTSAMGEVVKYSNHVIVPQILSLTGATLSGSAKPGGTLTVSATTTPADAILYYQWYADGKYMSWAQGPTYVVNVFDRGADIVCKVTGWSGNQGPLVKYTNHVIIDAGPYLEQPVIAATFTTGTELSYTTSWSPGDVDVTATWFANGKAVPASPWGALTVTNDTWSDIVVKVTLSVDGYDPVVKYSNHSYRAE
ncbi:MAG: hypothetical protein LBR19_02815 [Bifidobacteriaceae bacterium]|jgi:hypothetical protein|nr:hypothetical protein [Bifidobacteriaceae bacterium]